MLPCSWCHGRGHEPAICTCLKTPFWVRYKLSLRRLEEAGQRHSPARIQEDLRPPVSLNRDSPEAAEKQQKVKTHRISLQCNTTSRHHPTKPCPAHPCDPGLVLSEHTWHPNYRGAAPYGTQRLQAPQQPGLYTQEVFRKHQRQLFILWVRLLPAFRVSIPSPSPVCSSRSLWHRGGGTAHVCSAPRHLCKLP